MNKHLKRALVLGAAGAFLVVPSAAAEPTATTKDTVSMTDYRFKLSVRTVHTGIVVFTAINRGEVPHNFKVQKLNAVTRLVQAGERATLRVRFRKPGRYYYLCTVDNHVLFGMSGYLRVIR